MRTNLGMRWDKLIVTGCLKLNWSGLLSDPKAVSFKELIVSQRKLLLFFIIFRASWDHLISDFAEGQVSGLHEARNKDILRHIPFHTEKAKNLPHHWFCSRTGIRFAWGKDQCPRSSWQTHPNKLAPQYRPRHNNTKSSQRVTSVLWWFFVFKKVRRHLWRCDWVLRHGLFIP